MTFMTKEEALEFFNGVKINFEDYHKKCFRFSGEKDGSLVSVRFNCIDNIYADEFSAIEIFDKDMKDIEYFNTMSACGSDKEHIGKPLYLFDLEI